MMIFSKWWIIIGNIKFEKALVMIDITVTITINNLIILMNDWY